jgi:hypothetical protein
MKRLASITLVGTILVLCSGCATYVAVNMPGPAKDNEVAVGMHRQDVERTLGVGSSSQYDNSGLTTVRYEYADGPPQGSKTRAIVYVAGDVFTVFLSELIFWPIELYADKQIQRVGSAQYDHENLLVAWEVSRASGEVLAQQGAPSGPASVSSEESD